MILFSSVSGKNYRKCVFNWAWHSCKYTWFFIFSFPRATLTLTHLCVRGSKAELMARLCACSHCLIERHPLHLFWQLLSVPSTSAATSPVQHQTAEKQLEVLFQKGPISTGKKRFAGDLNSSGQIQDLYTKHRISGEDRNTGYFPHKPSNYIFTNS